MKKGWLDKYENGGEYLGTTNVGRNYSPAWGGQFQMGGYVYPVNYVPQAQMGASLPGATGMMYARTNNPAPSEGPYAKKTLPSAQNGTSIPVIEDIGDFKEGVWVPNWKAMSAKAKKLGAKKVKTKSGTTIHFNDNWEAVSVNDAPSAQNGQEMSFYQHGLDWTPRNISKNGSVVKDDMGYWNPDNWGKVVEIDSPNITMKGVNQPLLGISDEGDVKYMEPGKDYKFKGKKVKEYPIAEKGVSVNKADEYPLKKLDNLLNFTNYNKPKAKNGWLNKYK